MLLAEGYAQSVDEYTRQAAQLVRGYRWHEAIRLFEKALQTYPDEPALLLGLGSILVRSGNPVQGERLLEKALKLQPDDPQLLRTSAEAQLRQGKLASAIRLFREALKHQSNDAQSYHRLAFTLFLQGNHREALENIRRSIEINPIDASTRRFYALLLEAEKEPKEAYRQLRLAYQLSPTDAGLLFQLSQNRKRAGENEQALEFLELAAGIDSENPLYRSELSLLYEREGEKELAAEEAQKAVSLRQAFDVYLWALRLAGSKRNLEAARVLEPTVREHPEFTTGSLLLADLYRKLGQEKAALDLYLRVLDRDPSQSAAREAGAWIEARQGSLDRALLLLETTQGDSPNQVLFQAHREVLRENWPRALEYFRAAERENPLDPQLLQLISFCLNAQGNREEALRYLEKAQQLEPGSPAIRRQILEIKSEEAFQLLRERRWKKALDVFAQLAGEEEGRSDYFLKMAYCHQQLGEIQSAVNRYQTGLRLDPKATWARINLATCLYRLSRYQESVRQWEDIPGEERTADSYFQLGLSYAQLDRIAEAERAFRKALDLGKDSPELLYNLGVVQLRQNRPEQAWPLIRRSSNAGYEPAQRLLHTAGLVEK